MKNNSKKLIILFIIILLICLSTILIGVLDSARDLKTSTQFIDMYYEAIIDDRLNDVLNVLSPEFLSKTPKEEYINALDTINKKLGKLQTYELLEADSSKNYGIAKGYYYILKYEVEYSKYSAIETIVLYRKDKNDELKILEYKVDSKQLL